MTEAFQVRESSEGFEVPRINPLLNNPHGERSDLVIQTTEIFFVASSIVHDSLQGKRGHASSANSRTLQHFLDSSY